MYVQYILGEGRERDQCSGYAGSRVVYHDFIPFFPSHHYSKRTVFAVLFVLLAIIVYYWFIYSSWYFISHVCFYQPPLIDKLLSTHTDWTKIYFAIFVFFPLKICNFNIKYWLHIAQKDVRTDAYACIMN